MEFQEIRQGVVKRSILLFTLNATDVEQGGGESKTIPGQSMTIKEMLQRHQRGLPVKGSRYVPLFEYDEEGRLISRVPQLERMDISEIDELKKRTEARIEELEKEEARKMEERKKEDDARAEKYNQLKIEFDEFVAAKERKAKENEKEEK